MLTGVPTGFTDFDRISQGLNRGNLIIIAGRPGMGKTSFALNVAQHVTVRERKTVGIFSLEMSQQELALRILCSEADISFSRLRSNRVSQKEWTRIIQTVRAIGDAPLYIDDSPNPTLLEVASKSRRLKAERGLSADRARLPPADAGRRPLREPQPGDRRHQPRLETARQGAGDPGDRPLPALPPDRAAGERP